MQSTPDHEGGPSNPNRKQARLLEYDISSGKAKYGAEYVVALPLYTDLSSGKTKVAAQSESYALGHRQFLILACDSGSGRGYKASESQYRHGDIFSIKGASNVKSKGNDAVDGAIASAAGDLVPGVTAAAYCFFLDFNVNSELARFGLHNGGAQDVGLLNEK